MSATEFKICDLDLTRQWLLAHGLSPKHTTEWSWVSGHSCKVARIKGLGKIISRLSLSGDHSNEIQES